MKKGDLFSSSLENHLQESTIIHWHGLHVDHQNDGHPEDQIQPLEEYPYEFSVQNRAATYWYHTHAHRRTAVQAYYGLASLFIVEDEDEQRLTENLDLNLGETDIPLIIQDKSFDASGDLVYYQNPMGVTNGFLGDTILANLTYRPYLNVESRMYRFRILKASNARIYRLAFTKNLAGMPFYIIGTDGGLLPAPAQVTEAFLSPGERIDVLLDLSRARAGETIWLKSLAFTSITPLLIIPCSGDFREPDRHRVVPHGSLLDLSQHMLRLKPESPQLFDVRHIQRPGDNPCRGNDGNNILPCFGCGG